MSRLGNATVQLQNTLPMLSCSWRTFNPKKLYRNSSRVSTKCYEQEPHVETPDSSFCTDLNSFTTIICYILRHEMKEECCLLVYSWMFMYHLSMQYTPDCIFLSHPKMNTQAKAESIFAFRGCHNSETDQHVARARDVINIHLQPES